MLQCKGHCLHFRELLVQNIHSVWVEKSWTRVRVMINDYIQHVMKVEITKFLNGPDIESEIKR